MRPCPMNGNTNRHRDAWNFKTKWTKFERPWRITTPGSRSQQCDWEEEV